jgi:hypothetical protein
MLKDKGTRIDEFQRAAQSILELFQSGEELTGEQENTLIGTIHGLQVEYNDWMLTRQPVKEQTFPPPDCG